MITTSQLSELNIKAWNIRYSLLKMFSHGKAHHFGGSMSCAELMSALYFYKMKYSLENYKAPGRDRFIMSKGHSVPAQYAVLSELGIISPDELKTIKQLGSCLQGHPDIHKTAGLEAPTGSLGQGLSYANGIALSSGFDNLDFRIYVMLGDGEIQEGQVWEAAMTTTHYSLNNVTAIVDCNKYQSQGAVSDIMNIEPLKEKFESFGWHAIRVDGHDISLICQALDEAERITDRPAAIIADTVKGKGISFMENSHKYHNYSLTPDEYKTAESEILEKLASFTE